MDISDNSPVSVCFLQMIRLTQPDIVHDKKEKDSSSPEDGAAAIKKEAEEGPVTSQGLDQASPGQMFHCECHFSLMFVHNFCRSNS